MTVLSHLFHTHNLWLVLIALLLCGSGTWVTARLFLRAQENSGLPWLGWTFLAAISAGVAIWCTHFVSMLGFHAGAPFDIDAVLTIVSLLVAVLGASIGFLLADWRHVRYATLIGGPVIGVSIAAMHYSGIMAYRFQGHVEWNMPYLAASVILSVAISTLALYSARSAGKNASNIMASLLALAVLVLHFTGMAAMHVAPLPGSQIHSNHDTLQTLAIAITIMSLLIVGGGLASYLIDNRARNDMMERLRLMALNDTLTNLPNRTSFNERLDFELSLAQTQGSKVALIGIDLNRFKEINDIRGHNVGDEVLRIMGHRIKHLLLEEQGEFAARVGGDEFVALCRLHDRSQRSNLYDLLNRFEQALFNPIRIEDYELIPGASFGVAIYPDDASDGENLINNADLAMYRAKADIDNTVCFYEPGMDAMIKARRSLTADLRQALALNQLSIHYQVQVSATSGTIQGYEALLRWRHPQHGFISPSDFIPLAEENGLIVPLGEWVLRQACTTAAAWEPPYRVAVNVSPVQLSLVDLPQLVAKVLAETGLPPERLELELTESAILNDRERALSMLSTIKALGVSIALDDFGTGYSSLEILHAFQFSKIKIDRSFISELDTNAQSKSIVQAVLALGKSLDIPVLAEGIETEGQLALLNDEGCDEVQGYLFGRPSSLDDIVASGQIALRRSDSE